MRSRALLISLPSRLSHFALHARYTPHVHSTNSNRLPDVTLDLNPLLQSPSEGGNHIGQLVRNCEAVEERT
jgi:hypothetical protein